MIYPEVTKKKRVRGNVIVNIFRIIQMFVFKEISAQKKMHVSQTTTLPHLWCIPCVYDHSLRVAKPLACPCPIR